LSQTLKNLPWPQPAGWHASFMTKSDYQIRVAQPDDRAAWVTLYESIANEREWIGGEPPFPEGRVLAEFDRRRMLPGGTLLVAQHIFGPAVVAWIDLSPLPKEFETSSLYLGMGIDLAHRSVGLGRSLILGALDYARSVGTHTLVLDVFEHNDRAIPLYESMNFIELADQRESIVRKDGRTFTSVRMHRVVD
jgi:RimJ/RimL family protein N-acetyltransferase